MKLHFLIVVFLIFLLTSLVSVSAAFTIGNRTQIEEDYGTGDSLRGWLNISLENEPSGSLLSAFDSEISILDFLNEADGIFDCIPANCEEGYDARNEETGKSFPLNFGESEVIGLKLNGKLSEDSITSISFQIASSAQETCYSPLQIDILDNGEINWYSFKSADDFTCPGDFSGCFNSGEASEEYDIVTSPLCEKITLEAYPSFELGVNIIGTEHAEFKMLVLDEDLDERGKCEFSVDGGGEKTCIASLNLTEKQDFFICIRTKESSYDNKYKIKAESNEPCGFFGDLDNGFTKDYDIFARGSKYAQVGTFTMNNDEFEKFNGQSLTGYLNDYLEEYDNDCEQGCAIPIKFISGKQQTVGLSGLSLSYNTVSGSTSTNKFYDANKTSARINMDFQELKLEKANLIVPSAKGNYTARVYLNDEEIASERIEVGDVSKIIGINIQEVPAAVSVKFIVYVSDSAESYKWDFGDGTTDETAVNETMHTYSSIGFYALKIEVEDKSGKSSSRTFSISVKNPEELIELTIKTKKERLNEIISQLDSLNFWYKEEIEKLAGLDALDSELKELERKYEIASSSSEYTEIMSDLTELKVPYSLEGHPSGGDYFPDVEQINPDHLAALLDKDIGNSDEYKNAIAGWINKNIDVDIESRVYSLHYDNEISPILTVVNLKIKPKQNLEDIHLIIGRGYDEITFKENYKEKPVGTATAITFSELKQDEETSIEFILPEEIEFISVPVYISPEFSELPEAGEIAPCNFNGICEAELDETRENCPSDCKPWKKIIIYLAILLFAGFIVYIAMQEWYKRYYEGKLFKNRNNLLNLINFINNALNQGVSRDEIIKKLKKHKWSNEQIIYSFKKVKGKKTGMWEIPVFKVFKIFRKKQEKKIFIRR